MKRTIFVFADQPAVKTAVNQLNEAIAEMEEHGYQVEGPAQIIDSKGRDVCIIQKMILEVK